MLECRYIYIYTYKCILYCISHILTLHFVRVIKRKAFRRMARRPEHCKAISGTVNRGFDAKDPGCRASFADKTGQTRSDEPITMAQKSLMSVSPEVRT